MKNGRGDPRSAGARVAWLGVLLTLVLVVAPPLMNVVVLEGA